MNPFSRRWLIAVAALVLVGAWAVWFRGHERATLKAGGAVRVVAVSPDGALIAAAGEGGAVRVWGSGGATKFTLEGHPRTDENGSYLIVGVSYHCTAESYTSGGGQGAPKIFLCDFTAIPADSIFRPARITQKPRIQGPQTAIVVGAAGEEILTDEFGRIKVQFHWDRYSTANENSPCWVRVSQLWAGKNWGAMFLPRIGQEVIVEFLDGNPDRKSVV